MNLSRAVQDVTHSEFSTYLSKVAGLILIPRLPRRYSSHTTCATSAVGPGRVETFFVSHATERDGPQTLPSEPIFAVSSLESTWGPR